MPLYYILNASGVPVPCANRLLWIAWMQIRQHRIIAQDRIGDIGVSTVFLGIDHNFVDVGPPVLWETLLVGGPRDGEIQRYQTQDAARAGHAKILNSLRN